MSDDGTIPPPIYYSRPPAAPATGPDLLHQVLLRDWVAAGLCATLPSDEDAEAWALDDDDADGNLMQRLADLEQKAAQVEAVVASRDRAAPSSPDSASIAESLSRIADAMAPAPADVVGSPYVAKRLGCTNVWVAEMARDGRIPKHCLVEGTGNGKP